MKDQTMPADSRNRALAFNKSSILLISFGHLCHDIYTSFLSPLLPLLIERFALTYASAGAISVLMRLPSLLNPCIGAWAERFSMKYPVIFSPTLTAIVMCMVGRAPGYGIVLMLVLIAGFSSSCFHVPVPVLLEKLAGSRVGTAMSSFQIGGELARTLGPIIVLGAVSVWTIEGIYRLIPLGMLTSLVLYRVFSRLPQKQSRHVRQSTGGAILKTILSARRLFVSVFGILLCKSMTAAVLTAFLPAYLTARGESLWFAGCSLSLMQAAAIAGVLLSGTLSDRIGCRKVLLLVTVATPLSMILFLSASGWGFFVSVVLLGMSAYASPPVLLAMIQKKRFDFPAVANGIYMTVNFILGSIMVLLAGFVSDMLGIEVTLMCCALGACIGIPFILLVT